MIIHSDKSVDVSHPANNRIANWALDILHDHFKRHFWLRTSPDGDTTIRTWSDGWSDGMTLYAQGMVKAITYFVPAED